MAVDKKRASRRPLRGPLRANERDAGSSQRCHLVKASTIRPGQHKEIPNKTLRRVPSFVIH